MSDHKDAQTEHAKQHNSLSKDESKQAPDVELEKRVDTSPATTTDQYLLSKDEFLKYIEFDLWSRFQSRLWRIVLTVMTLITIAGYFGVRFYIDTSIRNINVEMERDFALKRAEILQRGRLLSTLSTAYQSQKVRLLRDIYFLSDSIERYQPSKGEPLDEATLGSLRINLHYLASIEDFSSIGSNSLRNDMKATDKLAEIPIVPPKMIRNELSTSQTSISNYEKHPVCDGTLQGALDNIRYSIVSLGAFGLALKEFERQLIYDNAASPSKENLFIELYEKSFNDLYKQYIDILATQLLDPKEVEEFSKYKNLYLVRDITIPNRK